MTERILPFVLTLVASLVASLVLTPVFRELNRRLGMVDRPDPRRLNTTPIPRGGGVAVFLSMLVGLLPLVCLYGSDFMSVIPCRHWKLTALVLLIVLVGYADDKWSLRPRVKLLGQVVVAALTWWWVGLGFADLWPSIPAWLDCILTVFWLVGAINAFNLIDGLDGLAAGLALIATIGMVGGLVFVGRLQETLFYFPFAGALLGFLRYNYHPASVFLGDSGSMLIGYVLAAMPLTSHAPNSFLVSVGVPLLAMGVPIFDTALAILRRTLRGLIVRGDASRAAEGESVRVMAADRDHLHHRVLRAVGLSQRKAAWSIYALAALLVLVGLVGVSLQSKAAGLWLATLAVVSVVIVRDMARVELFDAGQLLNRMAHEKAGVKRRRLARLTIPFYLVCDILSLTAIYFFCVWVLYSEFNVQAVRVGLLVRVATVLGCLVFFRTYATVWARAMTSNYLRLFLACVFGSVLGAVVIYYLPTRFPGHLKGFTLLYAAFSFLALVFVRLVRSMVRDLFYALDCSRLIARKDVSRILVYGAGLRYRAFRRELVRTTAANDRMIVGILDDDITLHGHYIGGIRILGSLAQAPEVINAVNADTVVIACEISDEWLRVVRATLAPTGVGIRRFSLIEKEI